MSTPKKITLKSSDGEAFEVDGPVVLESQTIQRMIEDDRAGPVIHLPKVNNKILAKVIEYCKRHVEAAKCDDIKKPIYKELMSWYADFVKVNGPTLRDLILAAKYLDIKSLMNLTCQAFCDLAKDKMPREMHKIFLDKNDFTPEEATHES